LTAPFPHFGEFMALLAAVIFSWTSLFFTTAGQRLGVTTVNLLRLPGATLCLALTHLVIFGRLWPEGLDPMDQLWLGISGVIGLALGDSALFKAFTMVGPRRSMTLMALAPVFTVILAWGLLGEHLGLWAMLGIVTVIGGVIIATLGRENSGGQFSRLPRKTLQVGLLLGLVASLGQGVGSAFAKLGMIEAGAAGGGVDPLGATLVRLSWATAAYWLAVLPRQKIGLLKERLADRRGVQALAVAILAGPFISVWISLVALKNTEAGIAQVLLGTVPIFVVLPSWLVYKDRPTILGLLGIVVAVAGGALLFLR
jgi:drug/metabolite transporter (DMT)-like permease